MLFRSRADQMALDVDTGGQALLVLSEVFDPGWHAKVNDQATPVLKVNGGLRGVVVPQGRSHVTLRYAPLSFIAGATLSALAWGGSLALVVMGWRRRRRVVRRNAAAA